MKMWSRNFIPLILCLILSYKISNANHTEAFNTVSEEDAVVFQKYFDMDKQLKGIAASGVKTALPILMQASDRMNLTAKCVGNILQIIAGIRKLKSSAFQFLDASGKPGGGVLEGNMHMLGDYDQCLNAAMEKKKGEIAFRGQYCLIHYKNILPRKKRPITLDGGIEELVKATKNTSEVVQSIVSTAHFFYYNPAKFGACVPSGCNEQDIRKIVKYVGEFLKLDATLVYCDDDSDIFLTGGNIAFMTCFVLIGALAVLGTCVEYYSWRNIRILKSVLPRFFLCFSILTNFPKAISTKVPENNISCLNGIRALTLFYHILLHQYYAGVKYYISSHVLHSMNEITHFFFQIVANGFLTADVYFFMGGLLNCYHRVKSTGSKGRKTDLFFLVVHRLVRISPAYIFFSFLMSLFRPYGPMRLFEKRNYVEKCNKNWWQNALFINNFFFQDETCAPHTWYIAADMQLFLLSLFIVPIFLRQVKKGIVLSSAIISCGIMSAIIWSLVNKLTPGVVFYRPNDEEINIAWNAHTSTFPHIAPYFTGILMGYVLAVKQDIHIPKICQVIGWPIAAFLFTSMLFITKIWNSGGAFTVIDSSFYFGFSKFVFVVGLSWMVLCCATGNGGIINYILSLPLWIPISRISFVVYLIAPFLQTFYFANSRMVVDGHRMPLIWRYAGDTVISCLLGFVIYVLIEAPFLAVEKFFLHRRSLLKKDIVKDDIINKNTAEIKKNYYEFELNQKNTMDSSNNQKDVS